MTLVDLAAEGRAPLAIAKARSTNKKIGDAAATYAAQASCPTSCVFFDGGGCYAEAGQLGKFVTGPLNAGARAAAADEVDVAFAEAQAIVDMDVVPGRPMRLHTVGDCSTIAAAQIVSLAAADYRRRGGGPVWTYTHAWRTVPREAWGTVSVLASCETPQDVVLARSRGYATAIVVEAFPGRQRYTASGFGSSDEGGETEVLPCPAQTTDRVTCSSCRLCFDDRALYARGYSIGFELHGTPFILRQARKALRTPDDPERRLTSRDLIPRLLADEPGLTGAEIARRLGMNESSVYEMLATLRAEEAIAA